MPTVFVDTAAICALFDQGDTLHAVASEVLDYLVDNRFSLVTNQWVEYEVLSRLKAAGVDTCRRYIELRDRIHLTVVDVDDALEQEALQIFWAYTDKSWGVVDCTSIALMYRRRIYYAFTSDHHFREAGFFTLIEDESGHGKRRFTALT